MERFPRNPRQTEADQRLRHQAEALVSSAHALAISGYTAAAEREPLIRRLRPNDWDFFLTVAGVFVAASALSQSAVSEATEDTLMEIVARDLAGWNDDALCGFEDCKALFEETYDRLAASPAYQDDQRFLASDAVGYWIAWNLLGHAPAKDEELRMMRATGTSVTHAFAGWWKA